MTTSTFPLDGPINLSVRLGHGSLIVNCVDDLAEARVDITSRHGGSDPGERIDVQMAGPTLVVHAARQGGLFDLFGDRGASGTLDVEVTVPSGTAMKIATFTAKVMVHGCSGGADVTTGRSEIHLDEVDGDLRLRHGSGSSTVERVTGSVTIRSGTGGARIGEILGSLKSGFGSGDLRVGSVRGQVSSRTGSGSAQLDAVYGHVDLGTGSGSLSVGLPAGLTVRLDVHTGSGRVRSELPIDDAPKSSGDAITVRARSGSGDVRLFRAA